jgi:hypothetical protein
MQPGTKKRIEDALYAALQKLVPLRTPNDSERVRNFWRGILMLLNKHALSTDEILSVAMAAGVWAEIPRIEPKPQELERILQMIETIPYEARPLLRAQLKALPRKPGGGRKKLLTPEEKQVCGQIGALLASGKPLAEAFEQVSRQFKDRHVSPRTIKRTWEKRGQ